MTGNTRSDYVATSMAQPEPPERHRLPLSTRVTQLQHEIAFDRSPTVTIERDELAAILHRYEAMTAALIRALHELSRVERD